MKRALTLTRFLIFVFLIVSDCIAYSPNTNVLTRVFAIKTESQLGTAFTVDHEGKQYLVTARHLFSRSDSIQVISILRDSLWRQITVRLVAPLSDSADVAVLAPPQQLSLSFPLPASMGGLILGQEAYFLGFPSLLSTPAQGGMNMGFPIPFIKHAIISAMSPDTFGNRILYLDGHNNPGFSGGPVVFWNQDQSAFCLAGVVVAFQSEQLWKPDSVTKWKSADVWGNSGIVVAIGIDAVLQRIKANPIGATISK